MRELLPDRYRARRGRVMHRVRRVTGGGMVDLESLCRKRGGVRGVKTTYPRAQGPEEDWSKDRYDYPDCTHCPPAEEEGETR